MYSLKLNEEDSVRLREMLRMRMIRTHMSVKDLSEETGYSVGTIYNYLNGASNSRFVAAALAETLNVTAMRYER